MKSPDAFRDRPMMIDAITPFDPRDPVDVRSIGACKRVLHRARLQDSLLLFHWTRVCRWHRRVSDRERIIISIVRSFDDRARESEGARASVHNPFRKHLS
jgi:hypothetical protein